MALTRTYGFKIKKVLQLFKKILLQAFGAAEITLWNYSVPG